MLVKDRVKKREDFTPTEVTIADFILEHTKEVIDLPLEQLASTLYVSKSSIIRFCKKLGFKGHKELCVQLAKEMNTFLVTNETITGSAPFGRNETRESLAQKILTLNYQALTDTYNDMDLSSCAEAVTFLTTHKKVYIYGAFSDFLVMMDFAYKLKRLGLDVTYSTTQGEQLRNAVIQPVDSVAVVFCYEGKSDELHKISRILQSKMIPMILMSGPYKGYLYKNADVIIHTAFTEERPKIAAMGSRTGMLLMVDILYSMLFLKNYDVNLQQIIEVEDILKSES